jgi:hypothetical protein
MYNMLTDTSSLLSRLTKVVKMEGHNSTITTGQILIDLDYLISSKRKQGHGQGKGLVYIDCVQQTEYSKVSAFLE